MDLLAGLTVMAHGGDARTGKYIDVKMRRVFRLAVEPKTRPNRQLDVYYRLP